MSFVLSSSDLLLTEVGDRQLESQPSLEMVSPTSLRQSKNHAKNTKSWSTFITFNTALICSPREYLPELQKMMVERVCHPLVPRAFITNDLV